MTEEKHREEQNPERQRFEDLVRKLVAVPKEELEQEKAEYERNKRELRPKREPQ